MVNLRLASHLVTLLPAAHRPSERNGIAASFRAGMWADVADQVRAELPGLAERVMTATGSIRPGFVLVVNDEVIRHPGPTLRLHEGDEICLIAALAGG
jgi:molybdopterin converting factor small subunit